MGGHVDKAVQMKRVAVFGNTGGGKSTLARRLADLTRLPLYPLDMIQFRAGGGKVPHEEYLKAHADLLRRDEWIIDGFGCVASAWERFSKADTLVYVDLPVITHDWWVTKRLLKGLFVSSGGLAGKQSAVAQHYEQLQGGLALPSPTDAQVPAACRRCGGFEAGSSREVTSRDDDLPQCNQARVCDCLIYPRATMRSGRRSALAPSRI